MRLGGEETHRHATRRCDRIVCDLDRYLLSPELPGAAAAQRATLSQRGGGAGDGPASAANPDAARHGPLAAAGTRTVGARGRTCSRGAAEMFGSRALLRRHTPLAQPRGRACQRSQVRTIAFAKPTP